MPVGAMIATSVCANIQTVKKLLLPPPPLASNPINTKTERYMHISYTHVDNDLRYPMILQETGLNGRRPIT